MITTRAVYRFDSGKLYLWSIHPGNTIRDVVHESEWRTGAHGLDPSDPERRAAGIVDMAAGIVDMEETQLPSNEVLRIIRGYDPQGFWTRRGE